MFLPECRFLQTNQSVKTKKLMMYSPGRPYIVVAPGSDVMGCRRPTDGVFSYVSSGTSHAGGVPHSGP